MKWSLLPSWFLTCTAKLNFTHHLQQQCIEVHAKIWKGSVLFVRGETAFVSLDFWKNTRPSPSSLPIKIIKHGSKLVIACKGTAGKDRLSTSRSYQLVAHGRSRLVGGGGGTTCGGVQVGGGSPFFGACQSFCFVGWKSVRVCHACYSPGYKGKKSMIHHLKRAMLHAIYNLIFFNLQTVLTWVQVHTVCRDLPWCGCILFVLVGGAWRRSMRSWTRPSETPWMNNSSWMKRRNMVQVLNALCFPKYMFGFL